MTITTRVSEEPEHIKRFRAFKLYYDKGQAYATDECKDGMKLLEDYDATSALLAETAFARSTVSQAADEMVRLVELEVRAAVGPLALNLNWVRDHCSFVRHIDDPFGKETFCVDGKPIFELGPIEQQQIIDGDTIRITFTRQVRRF